MIRSWKGLLALYTAAGFFETVFWGQMGAFTPLHLVNLGIRAGDVPFWVGLIAAVTGLAGLPFLPFWGALADRYARKPVIVRSFAVYVVAGLVATLAQNVYVFLAGRAVMSLALGNTGLMMTTLAERTPDDRHGLAFAIMNSAGPVGIFIGPLLGGPLVDRYGFRALMAIDVALMLVVVLALSFGYRDNYRGASREPLLRMAGDSLRIVFLSRRLLALFGALFFLYAGWMLAQNYLPLAVTALYRGENPATAIGLVLGGGGLLALLLGPLLGLLADRYGRWKVLIAGASVQAALWGLPYLTRQLVPFGLMWALIAGIASGVFSVSFSVLSDSTSPETRGRVMSFAYLPVNLGYFFGPLVGSLITRSDLFLVFPAALVYTLCSLFVLYYARKQARQAEKVALYKTASITEDC